MKSVEKGMSFSVITLSLLMFIQMTFPYYLLADHRLALPTYDTRLIYTTNLSEMDDMEAIVTHQREQGSLGITGGPDQPEVQSFAPMGVSDLVDPFTGDFSYNIPIMDVDGYPINLGYSAGIGMEQEATWVGLGWTLNPGVINRSLRGIPDDFAGDQIVEERNQKKNITVSTSVDADIEVFAIKLKNSNNQSSQPPTTETPTTPNDSSPQITPPKKIFSAKINIGLGISYNNFNGYEADLSFGPSFSIGTKIGASLGQEFSSSSSGGASIGMNTGISYNGEKYGGGISIGSSFNSRAGMQQLTISGSVNQNYIKNSKNIRQLNQPITYGTRSTFNLGMTTFTPQLKFSTSAFAFTARFKLGGDAIGTDASVAFTGSFFQSKLKENTLARAAYGYKNLQIGQNNLNAQLDFNRENDGVFTSNTPALPLTHLTYDIYSISGHGVAGNYRFDRTDIGYTFDPLVTTGSYSPSVGGEVNFGTTFKAGVDVSYTQSNGYSQAWENGASKIFKYSKSTNRLREASELAYDRSDEAFNRIGGSDPVYFELNNGRNLTSNLKNNNGSVINSVPTNERQNLNQKSQYFQTNQTLTPLTIQELRNGFGYMPLHPESYAANESNLNHHIGAFTVTKTDGMRYYYGLPAYSIKQENVMFSVGKEFDHSFVYTPDIEYGLVKYNSNDASKNNSKGIDHYYNSSTTPAYAHSYMLSCVLSPNYVDIDNIQGPSKGDIGDYITFDYKKIDDFKWRNPINEDQAYYDAALYTDIADDKANFIYGEKELYYLQKMETKNHIVFFFTSERLDGRSVKDRDGGLSSNNQISMQRLDSIKMYSRADFELHGHNAQPIKVAHFRYDYSLCKNYPGTVGFDNETKMGMGKLTLKEVFFTYQNSKRGTKNKYIFKYNFNPHYNTKNVDRWGNYKRNPANVTNDIITSDLKNSDFPYVGIHKDSVNKWASAWNLSEIQTPTGGKMTIHYEADDYAFVQHRQATQMFLIEAVEGQDPGANGIVSISDNAIKNRAIKFKLLPGTNVNQYVSVGDEIYFKAALSMNKDKTAFDYVPGYAVVETISQEGNYGVIKLKGTKLNDNGNADFNPISVAGIQYARNYLQRLIPPSSGDGTLPSMDDPLAFMQALGAALVNFRELLTGPNKPLWNDEIGTNLIINKSWVKLRTPNGHKLGGGYRVKQVKIYDNWNAMVPDGIQSAYGQEFIYEENGKSTGVATYEPQIGGEENVLRHFVANDIKMVLAPDSRNYLETPFGEMAFPSPSIGYAKVITKSLSYTGVTKNVTGRTENEFFTAREFPTFTSRTKVEQKQNKMNLNLLLVTRSSDKLALSQGFVIENNDMHGKPKMTKIFGAGQDALLSSVEYKYHYDTTSLNGLKVYKLNNQATLVAKDGSVFNSTIGRTYEAVADFRESGTKTYSGGLAINLNYTVPFLLVPILLGANLSSSETQLRTASFVKTIERKGLLYETVAFDNQSKLVTNNIAYDAMTGEIILTSVNNGYDDPIYNFTYPAHWIYDGMGQASINLDFTSNQIITFVDGYTNKLTDLQLFPGDELMIRTISSISSQYKKAWVVEANNHGVRIIDDNDQPLNEQINYLKVIRSGRRNLQSQPVGTITLSKNPLQTINANIFEEVLSAEAIQYDYDWKRFCSCDDDNTYLNPYKSGLKGNWFPTSTYVHLTKRSQDFYNENTNIRKDGVYESFNPMFKLVNGKWTFDKSNWTTTAQVTEFSPNGEVMETRDPLNRFLSNQLGYNQSLQVAVGVNAQKRQIAYTNFEDYAIDNCPDKFVKWTKNNNPITLSDLQENISHSAKYSLKVTAATPVIFSDTIASFCETEELCDFSQNVRVVLGQKQVFVPYMQQIEMSYEIIEGTPVPLLAEETNGLVLSFSSNEPFKVEVYLVDSNGCKETITIQ